MEPRQGVGAGQVLVDGRQALGDAFGRALRPRLGRCDSRASRYLLTILPCSRPSAKAALCSSLIARFFVAVPAAAFLAIGCSFLAVISFVAHHHSSTGRPESIPPRCRALFDGITVEATEARRLSVQTCRRELSGIEFPMGMTPPVGFAMGRASGS